MKRIVKNAIALFLGLIKFIYWAGLNLIYKLNLLSIHSIPIVINNFNRLSHPRQLIEFLEKCGLTRIIILDNNSTYLPLLKFYESCGHKVIYEKENYGHLAFWKCGLYNKFKWNYFIYTDSDVVPIENCPIDFIKYFKSILDKNPRLDKVGFGIKIDDLPDTFSLKGKIVEYEKRYWEKQVAQNIYDAPIDTTFALYKPLTNLKQGESYMLSAFRLGYPYVVRHMPWYVDSQKLSEEELYYIQTCNSSSSIGKQNKGQDIVY